MKFIYCLFILALGAVSVTTYAQSPTAPLNADYYHLVDRLEIKQGRWATGFHSSIKPYNRHQIIQLTDSILENPSLSLSRADRFNLQYLRDDSWEWVQPVSLNDSISAAKARLSELGSDYSPRGDSKRPLFNVFFEKKSDVYSAETPDFDIHVSPAVDFNYSFETTRNRSEIDNSTIKQNPYINSRGLEIRGSIRKRLGFYTYFSDNQAAYPVNIQAYQAAYAVGRTLVPNEGFAKPYKNGVDFLSARGYITFNALKIINLQFGHDRNFFGNGFRSLFLSDNSAPYLFMKFTTKLGRFQYTNLFTELQNTQVPTSQDQIFPKKYTTIHHLSVNIGDHVNVGIFESEVYSRDRLELNYLNPIILYRFVESYQGSADNAMLGIDFKANFLRRFLVYGQFMLDEFLIKDLTAGQGSWTNKFALQTGLKYIDAFGVPNLDLQGEMNLARPYTYSHFSGQTNYVHYNQPLAHPLGANFIEGLAIVKYQPRNRWMLTGIFGLMRYGADAGIRNYGGNLLLPYDSRVSDLGNHIGQGRETLVSYGDLRLSFMLKHNLFVDLRQMLRMSDSQLSRLTYNTSLTSFSIRWNMPYRTLVL
ncbi:hypothetical protein [Tellurirhabdus bombi]|uniref:hypothetical protein n=1 Tax=Tellurirhabdus bombi TaxID=2907205 RepID=UPI001F1EB6B0|nr:hypothetical protein [Tellurirhabdus bombi]